MAIYASKQTPDFKTVLVLPDGDEGRVPAGYIIEPAMSQDLVMVPLLNIGYWGWSWEFCLSFPSDSTRRAFRRLFESLPGDVQHSLCFAPRDTAARLAFWLDKLPSIPDATQRGEIEAVLRQKLGKVGVQA